MRSGERSSDRLQPVFIDGKFVMTPKTKVTVAIPTYNRSGLLKGALQSVLAQDYEDVRVIVLDNASTDDTETVVQSLADSRVTFIRNETNVGPLVNWNRAIELNSSQYLNVLPDDDLMLPGFIRESVTILDRHRNAAFSFTPARYVDVNRVPLENEFNHTQDMPEGVIDGLRFLDLNVRSRECLIEPSSAMIRATALAEVGKFDALHIQSHFDLNLYLRLARRFEVAFINKVLVEVRKHAKQITSSLEQRGQLQYALIAERIAGISYLLESNLAEDEAYRKFLARRLHALLVAQSDQFHVLVPDSYWSSTERLEMAKREIRANILVGDCFILVDDAQWGADAVPGYRSLPFLERDGAYWGRPADDETAIKELERLRQSGASFIVFAWPAFWWLDHYEGLARYLTTNFRCALKNSRLVAFDLRRG